MSHRAGKVFGVVPRMQFSTGRAPFEHLLPKGSFCAFAMFGFCQLQGPRLFGADFQSDFLSLKFNGFPINADSFLSLKRSIWLVDTVKTSNKEKRAFYSRISTDMLSYIKMFTYRHTCLCQCMYIHSKSSLSAGRYVSSGFWTLCYNL
jgi:hypothetical protein